VSFHQLVQNLIDDTLGAGLFRGSLWAFRPELVVCAAIIALLLARMVLPRWKSGPFVITAVGLLGALYLLATAGAPDRARPIFTGMLVFDSFAVYMRGLVLLFALLFASFTETSGIPDEHDATEFYVLALGAVLGMCLMVSANHMMIVFLGIEMASVPSYALAGILRHRPKSSEAALKFAVFGAGTAGVMLYGISLLVGALGSAHIPTMAVRLAEMMPGMPHAELGADRTMVLVLGALMLMVGLAFKLSAVPFHFWPRTFSRGPRPKWPPSCRSPRRPPPWACWCAWRWDSGPFPPRSKRLLHATLCPNRLPSPRRRQMRTRVRRKTRRPIRHPQRPDGSACASVPTSPRRWSRRARSSPG